MPELLNPIERKMAAGMSGFVAFLSEATCGEACWRAREDVCRCCCGGKNHGCMRSADGVRPQRTAKVDGYRYRLEGVGFDVHGAAVRVNTAHGIKFHYADSSRDRSDRNVPAKTRCASDAQIDSWPELASYREECKFWTEDNNKKHYFDKPYLLWIREDIQFQAE